MRNRFAVFPLRPAGKAKFVFVTAIDARRYFAARQLVLNSVHRQVPRKDLESVFCLKGNVKLTDSD
jgi:hypothetical protein